MYIYNTNKEKNKVIKHEQISTKQIETPLCVAKVAILIVLTFTGITFYSSMFLN